MKLRFLGTGTSTGNPEIGCRCEVCTSSDPRDHRLRTSALLSIGDKHLLIDCGPDFRMQMLAALEAEPFNRLDGVLLTHEHYDHVGGLDDLRTFCKTSPVDIFAREDVLDAIRIRMPYVFREHPYPGVPNLCLHRVDMEPFAVAGIPVVPIGVMHGKLPILGFRIGTMAYLTDMKSLPESEWNKLQDLDVLVVNALRPQEHITHQTVNEALALIARVAPRRAYLIHMSHHFGLHEAMQQRMPEHVFVAYDGLEISLGSIL